MFKEKEETKMPVYEREKDVLYIRLPREFDHFSSRNMKVETEALIEAVGIKNIVFDFTKTEFMDSTGVGILLGRYKRMKFAGMAVYSDQDCGWVGTLWLLLPPTRSLIM